MRHILAIITCLILRAVPAAEQTKFLEDEIERWGGLVVRHGVAVD
jgi:hypothetical protein